MSPLSTALLRVIRDEIGAYETPGGIPEGATAAAHARVMIELLPIRAALEARAEATRLDRHYLDLVERSDVEGWSNDPTGSLHLTSASKRWLAALNESERLLDEVSRLVGVPTLTEPGEGDDEMTS